MAHRELPVHGQEPPPLYHTDTTRGEGVARGSATIWRAPQRAEPAPPPEDLLTELGRTVQGEVRFDRASRSLYAADLSLYRQVPIGVVIPHDLDDVVATVAACHRRGVPILGRGCGTSLAGQTCNVAVVIDFSKYVNQILDLDPEARTAHVEPGVICDQLRNAAERHQLTLGPDPATHTYCTLGGMIGNNSCGPHSIMGGKTVDNVEELEILTYDGLRLRVGPTSDEELERIIAAGGRRGQIYAGLKSIRDRYGDQVRARFPKIPRRVSGYNLDELLPENGFNVARALVGTESTCAITLSAKLRLIPSPQYRTLLVVGYPDPGSAGDVVAALRHEHSPIALEAFHESVIEHLRKQGKLTDGHEHLPDGNTWLLIEFGGETQDEADDRARAAESAIRRQGGGHGTRVLTDSEQQEAVWKIRESGVGSSYLPGIEPAYPGWEDAAVPPERLGEYLRAATALMDRYGYHYTLYGHFGDGCVHTRIAFDPKTEAGRVKYRAFLEEAVDLVVSLGGVPSGEHGDGQARAEFYPKVFGPELVQAFREFKEVWDPDHKMNPGKIVDPYPIDANLRLGADYQPRHPWTHFRFPEDHGSLATATERCFGVGKCRHLAGGTMCPSFMVTREEQHTTRGRARLLFEMLRGDSLLDGWRDEGVKEALDLCLACKGCKGDCPTSTDVATYKAEFLSHYYEGRPRPASAHILGRIDRWARLASRAPGLANLITQSPRLSAALASFVGLAPEREIPLFAAETFKEWWRQRERWNAGAVPVILWADTFNNHFYPETARAAVEVLEGAGHRVIVPLQPLCCGRPLYDFGMLDQAKRQLRDILTALRPEIRAGTPVIALEPSCGAVFRDELVNLFPDDEDARRLSEQTVGLAEFLMGGGERRRREGGGSRLGEALSRERGEGAGAAGWGGASGGAGQRIASSNGEWVTTAPKDDGGVQHPRGKVLLHGHCHQKALVGTDADLSVLTGLGFEVDLPDTGCCGLAGSFGYEARHYDLSMKIGERVLLPATRGADSTTVVVTDGFSCRSQIAQGTDRRALHLAEVLSLVGRSEAGEGAVGHIAYPERLVERQRARLGAAPVTIAVAASLALAGGAAWWAVSRRRSRG
jgi:FAD/FMN-containing dehydrogenase/Fe-S oxidoreductase